MKRFYRQLSAALAMLVMVGAFLVPASPALAAPTTQEVQPQASNTSMCATYTVRWGDSLSRIARRYGTTWQTLAQANHLRRPNAIYPGQRLAIPCASGLPGSTGQGGSYVSSIYNFAVKYPAGWAVSVSNPPAAGVGRDPEYVRFQPKAGGLPAVQILALTGAAPITGLESCQPNVSFAGMKACKIEQPVGQNPATDLWVFQRGDAHFLIGVQYEDAAGRSAGAGLVETFDFTR